MDKLAVIFLLVIAVATCILAGQFIFKGQEIQFGGGGTPRLVTLVGSSADAEKLPANVYVVANSTSTDPAYDGGLVTQNILTTGVDIVRLNFAAKGSVSTSTVDVKLMSSYDGTNYFDMMYATSTPNIAGNGTTTPSIAPYVTTFVPGVATTSWSYDYTVSGTNFVRFLLKSNDTGHLNTGAQAYIQAIAIDEY